MDHFLVDYENIGEAGLKGIDSLGPDTSTVIFYSEHADKISFEMHQALCKCRSRLEFRKAQTGKKNALDFQLSTYLGYLVASHPGDRFFIISKDTGYRVVMDFWDKAGIQQLDYIGRAYERASRQTAQPVSAPPQAPLAGQPSSAVQAPSGENKADKEDIRQPEKQQEKEENRNTRRRNSRQRESQADEFKPSDELMNSLSQIIENEEERENIGRVIVRYKTKQGVNNAIVKMYGTEKAGELYKKIKPLLKDKKGNDKAAP